MSDFFKYAAQIITAAAASPLGILALLILAAAVLAFFFFKNAPIWARLFIFTLIFVAVCSFGAAVLHKTKLAAQISANGAAQDAAMNTLLIANFTNAPAITVASSGNNATNDSVALAAVTPHNGNTAHTESVTDNIRWVFTDTGAKRTYEIARLRGLSKYQSVLAAQGHNPQAQQALADFGEAKVDQFINSLGH